MYSGDQDGYVIYYPSTDDFRFSSNGSVVSTNDLIESVTYKGDTASSPFASVTPADSSILVDSNITSSYGLGSTQIVTKGTKLPDGEIKVNLTSPIAYNTVYKLYSGSDYLISTIDIPSNVTRKLAYHLGASYAGDAFTIPGQALSERCWNSTELGSLSACSADASQVSSPGIASGLVYDGDNSSFISACFRNLSAASPIADYEFSMASSGKQDVLIPFVKGTCSNINGDMYMISDNDKPKAFGTVTSSGREAVIGVSLDYKSIFINGTGRFPAGDYSLCIRKVGEDTAKRTSFVEIREC